MLKLATKNELAELCKNDGELLLGARHWTGNLTFNIGEQSVSIGFDQGQPVDKIIESDKNITFSGAEEVWAGMLKQRPERMMTDIYNLVAADYLQLDGDIILCAQYYNVIARAIELLREPGLKEDPYLDEAKPQGTYDAPIGRYIHLELEGFDNRIYYEEAGIGGIPLLLQHTAGCHGSQFRHLFENKDITDHFHLIAYDLPYHGKSLPPIDKEWWKEEYKLTGAMVRSVPVALAQTLNLDSPIFMGCSVGGMLALDLAYHHPDIFSHVISLEGALNTHADVDPSWLEPLWHPQVSNEFKARLMNGIMSPTSPERYRKEVAQVYAAGWPNAFLGDLYYYTIDYDLRGKAQDIDTSQVGVDILSGEFDMSGTVEMGQEAHAVIKGSTHTVMDGMGHFPMTENPVMFQKYLMPILERIRANR